MSTRLEVRSIRESTTSLQPITPLWCLSRLPTRKHAIALTLILARFISIHSSCLIIKQAFQEVHNRGHDYSNSFLTLEGCTTFTHMIISYLIADLVHESRLPGLVSA